MISRRPRLAALMLAAPGISAVAADDFEPLVRGREPSQFEFVGIGPETLTIEDGEIRLSGKSEGYFATRKADRSYVLSFEWKYERPESLSSDADFRSNSGL